jgi:hypothetical protein
LALPEVVLKVVETGADSVETKGCQMVASMDTSTVDALVVMLAAL